MASATLHLVRHAEPERAGVDPGLTDRGRQQALVVAERLRGSGASEVLCSSRRRATETATIVARLLGVACTTSPHAADLTPLPVDWSTVPTRYHDSLRQIPVDEQDLDGVALDTAFAAVGQIGPSDRTTIMVTHNFVIGWFVRAALDAPWWRWISLHQHHAAISTIRWEPDAAARLLRFNDGAM